MKTISKIHFRRLLLKAKDSFMQTKVLSLFWYASHTEVKERFEILSNAAFLIAHIQTGGTNNIDVNVASTEGSCCARNLPKL